MIHSDGHHAEAKRCRLLATATSDEEAPNQTLMSVFHPFRSLVTGQSLLESRHSTPAYLRAEPCRSEERCPDFITANDRFESGSGAETIRHICPDRAIPVFHRCQSNECEKSATERPLVAKAFLRKSTHQRDPSG